MSVLTTALGIGSLCALGGSLILPRARKKAYGDIEQDWQNEEITFDMVHNDDATVICKGFKKEVFYIKAYRIKGISYEAKPFEEDKVLAKGRASLINEMAKLRITARFFAVKRKKEVFYNADWQTETLKEIGDAESKNFKNSYQIEYFLALQSVAIRALEEVEEKLFSILNPCKPELLKTPDDRSKPCPLTNFLNYIVCGDLRDDLRAVSTNISGNLQSADLIFEKEQGLMTAHLPEQYFSKTINISAWGEIAKGELLFELLKIKGEIELFEILKPIGREKAVALYARKAREEFGNPFGNKALGEEAELSVVLLNEGNISFFDTQFSVVVRAKTEEKLSKLVYKVTSKLATWEARYSIETACQAPSWFNRIAGRDWLSRPLQQKNEDIASRWNFAYSPTGLIKSYWSETPVRSFLSASGLPYAFQFQATDANKALGNFCVFAPSGVGKSTLIMHLFSGLSKIPNFKTFVLDSKEGARFMIESFGGVYQSYDKLSLNPLDAPIDDLTTRQNIAKMIKTMLGEIPKDEDIDELVNHLIKIAFMLPVGQRTFDNIFDVAFEQRTEAKKSFAKWVTNNKGSKGFYSHIFNSPRDSLADFLGQSFMVGINMNEALEDDVLGASVVTHISTAIERIAKYGNLKGFAIFIDESANLLRNETFKTHATWLFREYRKMGGAVGMAFQDPSALFKSGVSDAVIENSSCFFFFPNPQGNREAYKAFNLNEEQLEFIYSGGIEGRRVLLVKRDAGTGFEESVILNVDLSSLGNALRFYQSRHDAVRTLETLKNKWGAEWLTKI